MNKPITIPRWDTNKTGMVEPGASHVSDGFGIAPDGYPEKPSYQESNYQLHHTGEWLNYINNIFYFSGDLAADVAAIGTYQKTLIVNSKPADLSADLVVPANIDIIWHNGCTLGCSGSFNITFDGSVLAGNYRLFENSLIVQKITGQANIAWFGFDPSQASSINTVYLLKAVVAAKNIIIPTGTYDIDNCLISGVSGLKIIGQQQAILSFSALGESLLFDNSSDIEIENIRLQKGHGDSHTNYLKFQNGCHNIRLKNISIQDDSNTHDGFAISVQDTKKVVVDNVKTAGRFLINQDTENIVVNNSKIVGNTSTLAGVTLQGKGNRINNTEISGWTTGIDVSDIDSGRIDQCILKDNSTCDLNLDQAINYLAIHDNGFTASANSYGIKADSGNVIEGLNIGNNNFSGYVSGHEILTDANVINSVVIEKDKFHVSKIFSTTQERIWVVNHPAYYDYVNGGTIEQGWKIGLKTDFISATKCSFVTIRGIASDTVGFENKYVYTPSGGEIILKRGEIDGKSWNARLFTSETTGYYIGHGIHDNGASTLWTFFISVQWEL